MGTTVTAHVHGFTTLFWAGVRSRFEPGHCASFLKALETVMTGGKGSEKLRQHVLRVQLVTDKRSLMFFREGEAQRYVRISVAMPTLVTTARGLLERGAVRGDFPSFPSYPTFESNTPFILRFMIDCDIAGASWLELPAGAYAVRDSRSTSTSAQLEVDITFNHLRAHAPEGPWQRIAPFRVLSFDIECMADEGFPDATRDPVIQIGNVVSHHGTDIIRNVFTLGECAPIIGATVRYFRRGRSLLGRSTLTSLRVITSRTLTSRTS